MVETSRHLFIGFTGTEWNSDLKTLIREFRPGGFVLFRRNVQTESQLKALLQKITAYCVENHSRTPIWAIDEEGGTVQRLDGLMGSMPSAREVASRGEKAVAAHATRLAERLLSFGIHVNFAPVLDLVSDPSSHFLRSRSLGGDPHLVARLGLTWIRCLQERGIVATAKHFPGLGRATRDPHGHLPTIGKADPTMADQDLYPFRQAVKGGVLSVMTSHGIYEDWDPQWPGTLSVRINMDILRRKWKFQGILWSDDLDMDAIKEKYPPELVVRRALASGVDGLLVCRDPDHAESLNRTLRDVVNSNSLFKDFHRRSMRRFECLLRLVGGNF